MKMIEAIVQPFKLEEVKDALMEIGLQGIDPPLILQTPP